MSQTRRHFPSPPPLVPNPPGLWRRTPPAIFPPLMGLFGLGLGWRYLAGLLASPALAGLAEAFLGAVTLTCLFCLVAWGSKPLRRPGVLWEELQILPGRAGVAAAVLTLSLMAAVLAPYAPGLALGLAALALAALAGLGIMVALVLLRGPVEGRVVTPVFHLVFVGYILTPLSLVPLGYRDLSEAILWLTIPVAALIWGASLIQLLRREPPAPLRPLLAIHLAPASLFATVSQLLGWSGMATGFALAGVALLLVLVVSGRWLLAAGFSPLWGALTFPLAALATALLMVFGSGPGVLAGALLLVAGTALTLVVAWRVFRAWAGGGLAAKTNAATV